MSICFSIFDCNSVSSSTQFITSSHWTCLNTFCLVVLLRLLLHWQTENCVFLSFLEETEEEFGFLHEQHGQRKSMLEGTTVQDSLTSKLGVFIGPLEAMSYLCSVHLCWVGPVVLPWVAGKCQLWNTRKHYMCCHSSGSCCLLIGGTSGCCFGVLFLFCICSVWQHF